MALIDKLTAIANAIRIKTGKTESLTLDQMASELNAIPNKDSSNLTVSGATVTVPAGNYIQQATKSVATATQATPSISVDSSGLITASATQTAGYVSAGTKSATNQLTTQAAKTITPSTASQTAVASGVYTTGAVTVEAIPGDYVKPTATKAAATITPGTSNQTIAAGTYCSGAQTIAGDADLKAANIKKGVNIFGVTGSYDAVALNFNVIGGTSAPSSPSANTIWVNTSTTITSWIFSSTQPTGAEGKVWISVGVSSSTEFNALKTNAIQVYPGFVKQYVSGVWVAKTAKIYQSSAWKTITSRVDYISNGGILINPVSSYNGKITQTGTNYKISSGGSGGKAPAVNFACDNMAGRTINVTVTSAKVYANQSLYYSGVLVNTAQATSGSKPAYVALTKMPTSTASKTYTLKIPDSFTSGYLTIFFETYSSYETYYNIKDMWIE